MRAGVKQERQVFKKAQWQTVVYGSFPVEGHYCIKKIVKTTFQAMPCFTLVPSEDHSFTENNYVTIYILKKLDPLNKKRRQAENQEKRQKRIKN